MNESAWEPPESDVEVVHAGVRAVLDDRETPRRLADYFREDGAYTGGWFERLGAGLHPSTELGCHDLLAVSMLSVHVPGGAVRDFLEKRDVVATLSRMLTEIPDDLDLWDAEDHDLDAANELWRFLGHWEGLGRGETIRSKIMARKRPRLIPISDDVIKARIGPLEGMNRWASYRRCFQLHPELLQVLGDLRSRIVTPVELSLLRVLDAAAWMQGKEA